MSYSFYPGCSLHSTGLEYGLSAQAVFRRLGLELRELAGWNCCGASSAHALNHTLALALPARTLALAQTVGHDLVTPCAACFSRMKNADYVLRTDPGARAEIETIVGFKFTGEIAIRPLLAVLHEDYGPQRIAAQVRRPLRGLKVVTYYGCLLVRPPEIARFDDPDDPHVMADLLRAVGADVKTWSYATDCCGGSLSLSRSDIVSGLVTRLAERAREAGAEAFVTACPLCQVNLEMRQTGQAKMPAFYFTELLGLAFGLPDAHKWWGKHLIDPRPMLRSAGLVD
ncbi:MAG TPA: CoB--CoM heterodisulfide reductase iron-sulfur subunit B family protein [Anaerolineales bacterium]|nr:CoB--CoM heterodisulfide reductase iron-sulfur subunit B family protein [Anaerolineales bacterium]